MTGKMTGKQAVMIILGVSVLLGSTCSFVSWKAAAQTKSVIVRPIKVVEINTSDPIELEIVFIDLQTKTAYRTRFRESLFDGDDRHKLMQSFEERSEIWVELAIQTAEGKFRSIEILRTVAPANQDNGG
jgi:hypothetical protein